MSRKYLLIGVLVVSMAMWVLATGCRCKYPQEEMDAARNSIADAKAADAPKYASEEFKSAEDMLARAETQANENECDEAKASAIETVRLAEIAKELALKRKAEEMAPPPPPPPPPEVKKLPLLRAVYFDFDKFNIRSDQRSMLEANGKALMENAEYSVIIEGHCDERGTNEYNLALGQRRADSAKNFLIGMGVSPSRMTTISYGEERPADPGHNEEAWAKNRKADFVVK